jgi:folate-binding protein YgfZ
MTLQRELARELEAVRENAGLFQLPERGVLEVAGEDRVRWLDGMISADVKALAAGSGAPGLLLTRQGRIVADLHVLARSDNFWLELEASALPGVSQRLAGHVIADDVTLRDRSSDLVRLAVEGPRAQERLAAAGADLRGIAPHGWRELVIADAPVTLAAYGFSGLGGFQLFVPAGAAPAVSRALLASGVVPASSDTLECLRIAAGVPWLGRELDETVLPAEARLEAAISNGKGCYTGQEVVTRMRSRGRVGHLLVGLRFESETLPVRGAEIHGPTGRIGQLTSSVLSPDEGAIGLGFVRAEAAEPGTSVRVAGTAAQIVALPMRPLV